jgi:hypothetical protein
MPRKAIADRDIPLPVLHPLLFITGTESHPALQDVLDDAGVADGLKLVPTLNSYVGDMSDHGVFREHGVPYFFLSCGHWAHYHQRTDTPDRLNYRKMERITRQVCSLLVPIARNLLFVYWGSGRFPAPGKLRFTRWIPITLAETEKLGNEPDC